MALNESDFPELYMSCGIFDIYAASNSWIKNSYAFVKAQCGVDDNIMSEKIIRKLVDLQLYLYLPVTGTTWFTARAKKTKIRAINKYVRDHFVIANADPKKVADWLSSHVNDLPAIIDKQDGLKTDKLSVGPCAFKADHLRYVKVRFDGVSVPFYFDDSNWDQQTTRQAILKLSGRAATDSIMTILSNYSLIILERAKSRLLNLSEIPEYGEAQIEFFDEVKYPSTLYRHFVGNKYITKGDAIYKIMAKNSSKLADPLCKPIPVYRFGSQWFTVIDDNVYSIPGFYNKRHAYAAVDNIHLDANGHTYADGEDNWITDNSVLSFRTLIRVSADDQYVHEKVARAMRAKL